MYDQQPTSWTDESELGSFARHTPLFSLQCSSPFSLPFCSCHLLPYVCLFVCLQIKCSTRLLKNSLAAVVLPRDMLLRKGLRNKEKEHPPSWSDKSTHTSSFRRGLERLKLGIDAECRCPPRSRGLAYRQRGTAAWHPGHPRRLTYTLPTRRRRRAARLDSCQTDSNSPIRLLPTALLRWQGSQPHRWNLQLHPESSTDGNGNATLSSRARSDGRRSVLGTFYGHTHGYLSVLCVCFLVVLAFFLLFALGEGMWSTSEPAGEIPGC